MRLKRASRVLLDGLPLKGNLHVPGVSLVWREELKKTRAKPAPADTTQIQDGPGVKRAQQVKSLN